MKVGSLVECIYPINPPKSKRVKLPKVGGVYTVSGLTDKPRGLGIYLQEFPDTIRVRYDNNSSKIEQVVFLACKFREIPSPQEISVESILKTEEYVRSI